MSTVRQFMISVACVGLGVLFFSACKAPSTPAPAPDVEALVAELAELHTELAASLDATSTEPSEDAESVTTAGDEEAETEDEVKQTDGDVDEYVHEALHRVGNILATLSKLEATDQMDAQRCEEIASAAAEVMSAYEKIDSAIHAGDAPDYGAVKEQISDGMTKLKELAG